MRGRHDCQFQSPRPSGKAHRTISPKGSSFRGAPIPYGISKWGVVGLTRGLGKELAPHGVRLNAIAPGGVATEMIGWQPGQPLDNESLPLRRLTRPEEIAAIAVFLACDESSAIVGECIVVNSANS